MNLIEMQKKQKELDERIIRDKNIVLSSGELLLNTCVALDVELAEMMNDHQGFKIWKENNEPKDGLLEEIADCMSFFLSIANQLDIDLEHWFEHVELLINWNDCNFKYITIKRHLANAIFSDEFSKESFKMAFYEFVYLAEECFGFTDKVEEAYYKKNEINHERQNNNY